MLARYTWETCEIINRENTFAKYAGENIDFSRKENITIFNKQKLLMQS